MHFKLPCVSSDGPITAYITTAWERLKSLLLLAELGKFPFLLLRVSTFPRWEGGTFKQISWVWWQISYQIEESEAWIVQSSEAPCRVISEMCSYLPSSIKCPARTLCCESEIAALGSLSGRQEEFLGFLNEILPCWHSYQDFQVAFSPPPLAQFHERDGPGSPLQLLGLRNLIHADQSCCWLTKMLQEGSYGLRFQLLSCWPSVTLGYFAINASFEGCSICPQWGRGAGRQAGPWDSSSETSSQPLAQTPSCRPDEWQQQLWLHQLEMAASVENVN